MTVKFRHSRHRGRGDRGRGSDFWFGHGFTLVEMVIVLFLLSVSMAAAAGVFATYQTRTAAHRAAQAFAMDLSLARTSAVRRREAMVVDFNEAGLSYVIRSESGDTLRSRAFGLADDIPLSSIDLQLSGDSLVFDTRGVGDLSGAGSSVGVARFIAGATVYDVLFNALGAAKIDRR